MPTRHSNPGSVHGTPHGKPGGDRLGDPRSQKRDLGFPSVSPFDLVLGGCIQMMSGGREHKRLVGHHEPQQPIGQEANGKHHDRQNHGDDSGQGHVPTILVGETLANAGQLPSSARSHREPSPVRCGRTNNSRHGNRLATGRAKACSPGERDATGGTIRSHSTPLQTILVHSKGRFQIFPRGLCLRRVAVLAEHHLVLFERHISLI